MAPLLASPSDTVHVTVRGQLGVILAELLLLRLSFPSYTEPAKKEVQVAAGKPDPLNLLFSSAEYAVGAQ